MPRLSFKEFMFHTHVFSLVLLITPLLNSTDVHAQRHYPVSGLVLGVDRPHKTMVVSCREIPGYMDAMVMPFKVPDVKSLDQIVRGALVDFVLVVGADDSHAEDIKIRAYNSAEREPAKSGRLQGLDQDLKGVTTRQLKTGEPVPDFNLIDQQKTSVRLSQFSGKVVAINFIYTRCVLPEYCVRSANNFGSLQKRFQGRLGRDLVLLSLTFDPVHDRPEVLKKYAQNWKANSDNWHFLTGETAEIERVSDLFGVTAIPEEGLYVHSVHTAIVDRQGKLLANLEGNEFTSQQLADLVEAALEGGKKNLYGGRSP